MWNILIQIIIFLTTILVLVTVHEWGHFFVAKTLGVRVLKFSIGFGRPIWRHVSKDNTEYVIACLPLGGYVKLLDEREGAVLEAEQSRAFNRQSVGKRIAIILAGPLVNWLFAGLIFWALWMVGMEQIKPVIGEVAPYSIAADSGLPSKSELVAVDSHPVQSWSDVIVLLVRHLGNKDTLVLSVRPSKEAGLQQYQLSLTNWKINNLQPDLLKSLGLNPYSPEIPPLIKEVKSNSPAAKANIQAKDRILALDGKEYSQWQDMAEYIQHHPLERLTITLERNKKVMSVEVIVGKKWVRWKEVGYLGVEMVSPQWPEWMRVYDQKNIGAAFVHAAEDVWSYTMFNFIILGKMVTGNISLLTLGGPIAIFESSAIAFAQGLMIYAKFLGIISIMLACLNILPIPGLDGSHILFLLIEKITKRPVSVNLQILLFRLGFIVLILLMTQATVNDLMRIFQ